MRSSSSPRVGPFGSACASIARALLAGGPGRGVVPEPIQGASQRPLCGGAGSLSPTGFRQVDRAAGQRQTTSRITVLGPAVRLLGQD